MSKYTRRETISMGATALAPMAQAQRSRVTSTAPTSAAPNIIVVLADDMGYSDAGCYGGEIGTPTLDGLAQGGLRFTQMYSTSRCWPSRSCLMSGYYPQQVGRDPANGIWPKWARFTPQYLQMAGYRTYHSGKWHVPGKKPVGDAGFHHSYFLQDQHRFFNTQEHYLEDVRLPEPGPGAGFYATRMIADRGVEFLLDHSRRYEKQPYFLYLCFTAPHFPLHALPDDIARQRGKYDKGWDAMRAARYARQKQMGLVNSPLPALDTRYVPGWNLKPEEAKERIGPGEVSSAKPWTELTVVEQEFQARKMEIHAAMVARMDAELARVLAQARQSGDWENTLVLFISDNGASAEMMIRGDLHDKNAAPGSAGSHLCLGPGFSTAANTPFRLHKHWNHEGGISSPSIWHWPKGIRAKNELRRNPAHFVDLLPTFLEVAGVEAPREHNGVARPAFPGQSLVPVLAKDNSVVKEHIYFRHEGNRALRKGNWKLVRAGNEGNWELYDVSEDRGETRDLARQFPDRVQAMAAEWEGLDRQWSADNARGR
ncbi:MAG: arylsulfatase [Bryobacter sp.]|nr:arylsulfatase [Bryobacter sp.]